MLRLSKLTDYAVVVLVRLADEASGGVRTSPGLAACTGIPEPTVAKVLKALAGAGFVTSQRGARGGYRLARPLSAIPVSDVIAVVDGPIALTACVEGAHSECEVSGTCPVRGRWDPVNAAIHDALSAITLADMRAPPPTPPAYMGGSLPFRRAPARAAPPAPAPSMSAAAE